MLKIFLPFNRLSQHLNFLRQVKRDKDILEQARNRIIMVSVCMGLGFSLVGLRLTDVMVWSGKGPERLVFKHKENRGGMARADICDRNGVVLATNLVTASVYANPKELLNKKQTVRKLAELLEGLDTDILLKRVSTDKSFVWIKRHVTPKQQDAINRMGLPGVYLIKDQKRVYPHGNLASHVNGICGVDGSGLTGIEKKMESNLASGKNIQLTIDVRLQHIVRDVLSEQIKHFKALGGNAIIMDRQGNLLAMVSLPDYDPNTPKDSTSNNMFNRNTLGLYEPGSVFKVFNTAIYLDTGQGTVNSVFDTSKPVRIGRFNITDFKGLYKPLPVWQVFLTSSNRGSVGMALTFGKKFQRSYFEKLGLLSTPKIELPEISGALRPVNWTDATVMTLSYGYGMAVNALQLIRALAGILNDGYLFEATLIKDNKRRVEEVPVISQKTSRIMRKLTRMAVTDGTVKQAGVPGFYIMGKTGTAHVLEGRSYSKNTRITTYAGAIVSDPEESDVPDYYLVVQLDDPKATPETYGYATAGWNAAKVGGLIWQAAAPLLGISPQLDAETQDNVKGMVPVSLRISDDN